MFNFPELLCSDLLCVTSVREDIVFLWEVVTAQPVPSIASQMDLILLTL
jgi:hypothetical protein